MESEAISDAQIRASSQLDDNHSAGKARLHLETNGNVTGGWSALQNDLDQWLQVDLGSYTTVTRIATQGRNAYNEWVTKYILQYNDDGVIFHWFKEPGSSIAKVWVIEIILLEGNQSSPLRNVVKCTSFGC